MPTATKRKPAVKKKTSVREKVEAFEARFIEAYMALGENAQKAYKACRPYVTMPTAGVQGCRVLKRDRVKIAIAKRRAKLQRTFDLTTERVLREHGRLVYFDPKKLFDKDGQPLPLHLVDDDTAAALSAIETFTTEERGEGEDRVVIRTRHKIRPYSKPAALNMVNKILRVYDKPPPPPPPDPLEGDVVADINMCRRVAFLLRKTEKEAKAKAGK